MQPKQTVLDFKSDIAPHLTAFFEEKYRLGYKYRGIDSYLKSFDKFLLDKDCKDSLSKEVILKWLERKPHHKATTIEHNVRIMQNLADFLNRNGFSAYRATNELIPKKAHDFTPYIFSYDEISAILSVFDNLKFNNISPKKHIVYPLLFRVLCFCGLRISEALDLKVKDIDFGCECFLLRDTKNCQDRIIPLDNNLKERFVCYRNQMNFITCDDYFFPAPDGFRYGINAIEVAFRNAMNEVGIPYRGKGKGPRLHDLRHTFCVHSLQKLTEHGEDPYAVLPILMTYLGHRTVGATSRYVHLSAESYPAILKQTEAVFGNLIPVEDDTNYETN
jgi:integrase